ncbi:MAG: hypothetical protein HeimC2_44040 [Candidatus Heimdallarchaeota archaeon LC_2]|nr:MAG: hypothetical protein HeimC2_44040 [Candidatus Heimdallarchaeota archaeon LC_2]
MGDFSNKFLKFSRINNVDKLLKNWIEIGLIKKIMIYKDNNYFDGIYTSPLINYHLTALHSDKYIQGLVSALLQSCVALSKVISDIKLQESGQDLYHFYSGIIREGEAFDMDQKNWLTQYFHTDLTCNLILGLKRHGIIKIRKGSRDDFKLTSTGLEFIKVLREYYSYLSELDNFVSNTDSTQFNNLENSFKIDMIVPESLEIFVRKETTTFVHHGRF